MIFSSFVDEYVKIANAKGVGAELIKKHWPLAAAAAGGGAALHVGSQAKDDWSLGRRLRIQQERARQGYR